MTQAPTQRARAAAATGESWFGPFRPTGDSPSLIDDSRFGASWQADGDATADRSSRNAGTFERIYRAFIAARATLGAALLVTIVVASTLGVRPSLAVLAISGAYALLAIGLWLDPKLRRDGAHRTPGRLRGAQWLATIGVDLICFAGLYVVAPASGFNYVALLVMPVLMAGVLTPRLLALATAATVTLVLLATAGLGIADGGDLTLLLSQAGLAGIGFFVVSVLAGELAVRLAREEKSARGSLELARQQAQLNRLVIEEMADGVLVVDRGGRVRAANPAARRLLAPEGTSRSAPFQLRGVPAWGALVAAVERAFAERAWPEAGRDVVLPFAPETHRTLRVRARFTRRREPGAGEEYCVLFLEDVRTVQERSRQEKLAAMGRISAGIAHEIRNPLAAIAQANALLAEDATEPAHRQLTRLVGDNVERLKRIVDDVLEAAPGQLQEASALDAVAQLATVAAEWAGTADDAEPRLSAPGVRESRRRMLEIALPEARVGVLFDAEHLRRVLVNLLDNALRHASGAPGSIRLELAAPAAGDERVSFSVLSDGAPIAADVEPYLFEPFFSTRSRGTGLGLYICRELCERYGARIDYRLHPAGAARRNDFSVDLRRGVLAASVDPRMTMTT